MQKVVKIPYKNYICLSLFKYDILEKNNIVCKQYTIYPLSVKENKLYLYDGYIKEVLKYDELSFNSTNRYAVYKKS